MSAPPIDPSQLGQSISYHAWNKDQTMIAVSPNTNEIVIYAVKGDDCTKWEKKWTLDEHGGQVSGIDWCPETNLIVSCGHDRNAYVWKLSETDNQWKPTLVILRINRAATFVKWSPNGNKFAVGSGAKCVPVCHFEQSNDWWISKMIKKHKSSVLSLAWCPNNKFIVTGSSDMKARVFSAFLEEIDSSEDDGFGGVFPNQHQFGEVLAEFDHAKAWVNAVAWSPAGFRIAFTGHGSTVHFAQLLDGAAPIVLTLNSPDLPALDVAFLSDNSVVTTGFDMNTSVYQVSGGSDDNPAWSFREKVDKKDTKAAAVKTGAFGAARNMFSEAATKGVQFGQADKESAVFTKHKNVITNVQLFPNASGVVTKFTTTGLDGRVCFWDVSSYGLK